MIAQAAPKSETAKIVIGVGASIFGAIAIHLTTRAIFSKPKTMNPEWKAAEEKLRMKENRNPIRHQSH